MNSLPAAICVCENEEMFVVEIAAGISALLGAEPMPSRPSLALPQHFVVPEDSIIQVCESPAEIETTGLVVQVRQPAVVAYSGC